MSTSLNSDGRTNYSINVCHPGHPGPFRSKSELNLSTTTCGMSTPESNFYTLKAEMPDGEVYDFVDLKGKTVLIVNVASKWYETPNLFGVSTTLIFFSGFTPQYTGMDNYYLTLYLPFFLLPGLQRLYDKYKDKGLEILAFPCNQFVNQEPGDDAGIAQFCTLNYGVTFPLMKKSDVNGDNTNEVYKWLKAEQSGLFGLTRIKVHFMLRFHPPVLDS